MYGRNSCSSFTPRLNSAIARQQSQLWSAEIACAFGIDVGVRMHESSLKLHISSDSNSDSAASSCGNVQASRQSSDNTPDCADFVKSWDAIHLSTYEIRDNDTNAVEVSVLAPTMPHTVSSSSITDVLDKSPLVRTLILNHNSR